MDMEILLERGYEPRDGFLFNSIFDYRGAVFKKEAILINDKDTEKYVNYINKHKIDKVSINIDQGEIESLAFLLNIPHVKYLVIEGKGIIDYSPLYKLKELKLLNVGFGIGEIFLDRIEGLEAFHTFNPVMMRNIGGAKSLKSLQLYGYNNSVEYQNLQFLNELVNLDTLILREIKVKTLDGLEKLNNLKVLRIIFSKTLMNIDALSSVGNSLKHLYISYCNKIEKYDALGDLRELVFLMLLNIKTLPSLSFVNNLTKLNSFVFCNSNVIDGDLTPIVNLVESVVMPIKRHYFREVNGEKLKVTEDDLPYGNRVLGDEEIELWRRLET